MKDIYNIILIRTVIPSSPMPAKVNSRPKRGFKISALGGVMIMVLAVASQYKKYLFASKWTVYHDYKHH